MNHGEFYLKRLHALSGFFLLLFLCVHFFLNSYATVGSGSFNAAASFMQSLPHLTFVEILLLGVPIAFHGIYGLVIWYRGKGNLGRYGYFRNWMYFFQEISGAVLLVFLVMHVWGTRIAGAIAGAVSRPAPSRSAAICASTPSTAKRNDRSAATTVSSLRAGTGAVGWLRRRELEGGRVWRRDIGTHAPVEGG